MSRHLTDTPASLKELRPDLSSKFVNLIEGLMVKDPAKRIPSAAEAATMFEGLGKKNSSFWKLSPLLKKVEARLRKGEPLLKRKETRRMRGRRRPMRTWQALRKNATTRWRS